MLQDNERDFEEFLEGRRRRLAEIGTVEPEGLTRVAGSVEYFRGLQYPCTPEREAEIEKLHAADRKRAAEEHRSSLIAFAVSCIEGKRGDGIRELAGTVLSALGFYDYIDPDAGKAPENLTNLVLWDLRRQVAWTNAKARGDVVPSELKTREECLAIYKARKVADEKWADNDVDPLRNIPPMDPLLAVKRSPVQGRFDDMLEDRRLPPERD